MQKVYDEVKNDGRLGRKERENVRTENIGIITTTRPSGQTSSYLGKIDSWMEYKWRLFCHTFPYETWVLSNLYRKHRLQC